MIVALVPTSFHAFPHFFGLPTPKRTGVWRCDNPRVGTWRLEQENPPAAVDTLTMESKASIPVRSESGLCYFISRARFLLLTTEVCYMECGAGSCVRGEDCVTFEVETESWTEADAIPVTKHQPHDED